MFLNQINIMWRLDLFITDNNNELEPHLSISTSYRAEYELMFLLAEWI